MVHGGEEEPTSRTAAMEAAAAADDDDDKDHARCVSSVGVPWRKDVLPCSKEIARPTNNVYLVCTNTHTRGHQDQDLFFHFLL